MTAVVVIAKENFPAIGTSENPATFYDGSNVFLCYRIAPIGGDGNAVIKFKDVIDFRISPMNVDALPKCRYPLKYWEFNEILDAEETQYWKSLKPRFWMISFRDVTVEILFEDVEFLFRAQDGVDPRITLLKFLGDIGDKNS